MEDDWLGIVIVMLCSLGLVMIVGYVCCSGRNEAVVNRMETWNTFAASRKLEPMTYDEALQFTDQDIKRAMLAAKACSRGYGVVNPPHHSTKYGEVED